MDEIGIFCCWNLINWNQFLYKKTRMPWANGTSELQYWIFWTISNENGRFHDFHGPILKSHSNTGNIVTQAADIFSVCILDEAKNFENFDWNKNRKALYFYVHAKEIIHLLYFFYIGLGVWVWVLEKCQIPTQIFLGISSIFLFEYFFGMGNTYTYPFPQIPIGYLRYPNSLTQNTWIPIWVPIEQL